jgi:hypothetical protein
MTAPPAPYGYLWCEVALVTVWTLIGLGLYGRLHG